MIWGGTDVIIIEVKYTINVMCLSHSENISSLSGLWKNCLPWNQSLVSKTLGTTVGSINSLSSFTLGFHRMFLPPRMFTSTSYTFCSWLLRFYSRKRHYHRPPLPPQVSHFGSVLPQDPTCPRLSRHLPQFYNGQVLLLDCEMLKGRNSALYSCVPNTGPGIHCVLNKLILLFLF